MYIKKPKTITKEKIAEKLKGQLGLSATLCEEIVRDTFSEIFCLTKRDDKTMLQNLAHGGLITKRQDQALIFDPVSRLKLSQERL